MNHFQTFAMAIGLLGLSLLTGLGFNSYVNNSQGIHSHPSGKAVYIEGNGCIVNNVDVTANEFEDMLTWCATQHQIFNQVPEHALKKGWYPGYKL